MIFGKENLRGEVKYLHCARVTVTPVMLIHVVGCQLYLVHFGVIKALYTVGRLCCKSVQGEVLVRKRAYSFE